MAKDRRATARIAIKRTLEESSTCEQWMIREVYTVAPSDAAAYARELLARHRINQLPVVGNGKLLGIVTDRDLRDAPSVARASVKSAGDCKPIISQTSDNTTVEAIMTHPVIALSCHSTLVNAAGVMRQQRIGSVPIVSGNALVGIVTRSDILDALMAYANDKYKHLQAKQSITLVEKLTAS